uniref:Stromal cell-derived factor 2 n=1 Tax=Sarcoptes scabiei TaxID=52283 RepID=A0A834R5S1_SARSC
MIILSSYLNSKLDLGFYEKFSLLYLLLLIDLIESRSNSITSVTCGSVIKLMSVNSGIRLHSHDIKYGSGSGQQSVTGTDQQEDINSYWQIRPKQDEHCERGEPIRCGSIIRLTHLQTRKNLHSHHFSSPLSNNQEVSCFGKDGEGDTGDNWTVLCGGSHWETNGNIRLKHVDTEMFLASSGHSYGRPIHGQMEIIAQHYSDSSVYWTAKEGIYVKPNDQSKYVGHDEL